MARDRLNSDYSENMSDATACSYMVSSCENRSARSSMFQEPFFLHPPGSRPRDGLYINPMSSAYARQKDNVGLNGGPSTGGASNGSESFYLHSPHELVYTRITHLFDETPSLTVAATSSDRPTCTTSPSSSSSSRASTDRKDELITVKVDVHINNNGSHSKGSGSSPVLPSIASAGSSPRSEHAAKATDSGSEHAYEQICIGRDEAALCQARGCAGSPSSVGAHKKLAATDNVADTRSHRGGDRRYSRSSSASESSNMSSEVHYSSATSTPPLSRNSSNERMNKSPKVPDVPTERKISTANSTRADSEKDAKPTINGFSSIFRPPPPPPPPPPEIEEVVIVTSKVVESTVKEENKHGSQSTTHQEQKCEATITTISAASSKSGCGSNEATTTVVLEGCRGGESPETIVGSGQPAGPSGHHHQQRASEIGEESGRTFTTTTTTSGCQVTAHLVNRHMVLPFIPPKFAAQSADSDTLLKPSEYLRSICKATTDAANTCATNNLLSKARSVDNLDIQGRGCEEPEAAEERKSEGDAEEAAQDRDSAGPPPPPLPPPPANGVGTATGLLTFSSATAAETRQAQQLQQPLATISIHDLSSVQLRRTNAKMHAAKTFSAPPNRSVSMNNVSEAVYVQRTDLIAELKKTRDIPGIKKLKVERAQNEKSQERSLISEINKNFSASNFVDQIPEKDSAGNVIPIWKRQMLARKAAERAKREMEEKIARENEEKRIQAIPPWKRQLLARKDSENKCPGSSAATQQHTTPATTAAMSLPKIEVAPKKELVLEVSSVPVTEEIGNKAAVAQEEKKSEPNHHQHDDDGDDDDSGNVHIIPWRAQLRKTNSKLNILD
ncbi:uncharacterized protein LOC106635761 [Copidosoma floridanum]|uniref:uncharacterized protein LOC106635761 n=1 Tax=Copidosoma floridanum TaxID=29053 RepID=UPI0006C994CE|nr:uncharacterized protein LOC106635761 [Copidosoma floridanum]